jgi:hypothetical protein
LGSPGPLCRVRGHSENVHRVRTSMTNRTP